MKFNKNAIIVGLLVLVVGLLMVFNLDATAWISVGGSLLASSLVILLNAFLVDAVKEDPLKEWGIEKVYYTRAEKNNDSDPLLDKARFRVDGVAFGLSSFRAKNQGRVENALRNGVNFRLLVMNPNSQFVRQRDLEEDNQQGHIAKTIHSLVSWADELNKKGYKGKIEVKGYSCMTLDFYWRIDDDIYIGPYWYKRPSQVTITYKFKKSGKCFATYAEYFEQLWSSTEMEKLTS